MVYHHIQSLEALEMRIVYHIFDDFSNLYLNSIEACRAHVFAGNRSKNNFRNSESHSKPVQVAWSATWPQRYTANLNFIFVTGPSALLKFF
jgi:hypothetical protein